MMILCRRPWGILLLLALLAPAPAAFAAFECPVKAPPATKPMPDLATLIKPYDDLARRSLARVRHHDAEARRHDEWRDR